MFVVVALALRAREASARNAQVGESGECHDQLDSCHALLKEAAASNDELAKLVRALRDENKKLKSDLASCKGAAGHE